MKKKFTYLLLVFSFLHSTAQVTLELKTLPAYTPKDARFSIICAQNDWNAFDTLREFKNVQNKWQMTISSPKDTFYYKVARFSNNSLEVDANYNAIPNRILLPNSKGKTNITVQNWADFEKEHSANNNVWVANDSFYSNNLQYAKKIIIYLPNDYSKMPDKRYPVIYAFQGQNLFDNFTASYKEWRIDEALRAMQKKGDNGCIVVGIADLNNNTLRETNPFYKGFLPSDTSLSAAYARFVSYELKPYIDSLYRTKPSRIFNGIIGADKYAQLALFTGLNYRRYFSKIGVFSPFFEDKDSMLGLMGKISKTSGTRVYITYGNNDTIMQANLAEDLNDSLKSNGKGAANTTGSLVDVKLVSKVQGQHNETFWGAEFIPCYEWLFDGYNDNEGSPLNRFYQKRNRESDVSLKIYPNPAQSTVTIESDAPSVKILTDKGVLVKEITNAPTNVKQGKYSFSYMMIKVQTLDIGELLPGNYYVVATSMNNKSITKILIVK
jgi:predicted alpha/beta superfamily hydrolase